MSEKTTAQVADQVGTSRKNLNLYLVRHPELRPAKRLQPSGDLLWTEQDIQRLIETRATRKHKGGRPKKK